MQTCKLDSINFTSSKVNGLKSAILKLERNCKGIVGGSAGEESATGGQKSRSGDGNWRADRPTGTGRQARGQTGEGSLTGRVE